MKMTVTAKNLGAVSMQVYELFQGLDPEERTKVVNSVLQLYGDEPPPYGGKRAAPKVVQPSTGSLSAQQYFVEKKPQNKGEMLAVAARWRELHGGGDVHQM